jgi:two-component system nitrate/nitrite response regulator NarL
LNGRTFKKRKKDRSHRAIVLFASPVAELRERLVLALQSFFTIQEATEWEELERAMASVRASVLLLDLALLPPEGIGSISAIQRLSPSTKIILLSSVCDEKEAISALKSGAKGVCHKDIEPSMLKKAIEVVQKGEVWVGRKIISHLLSEVVSLTESREKDPPNPSEVCLDPFGGAKPRLLRRSKEAPLRVNPEPSARAQAEGKPPAFMLGIRRVDYLTPREFQIARMVGNGAHNKEIAHQLNITERTVKAHLTAIFNKLQIPDRLRLGLFIVGHHLDSVSPLSA